MHLFPFHFVSSHILSSSLQMMDLFFFMFLLSIWVVAYGVAKQGIMIENEERLNWIVRGAVYDPYLIIFGNVPSNIDSEQFTRNEIKSNYYYFCNNIWILKSWCDFCFILKMFNCQIPSKEEMRLRLH